jgi:hypothetical protein
MRCEELTQFVPPVLVGRAENPLSFQLFDGDSHSFPAIVSQQFSASNAQLQIELKPYSRSSNLCQTACQKAVWSVHAYEAVVGFWHALRTLATLVPSLRAISRHEHPCARRQGA